MLTLKNASGYALGRPLAVNVPSSPARPIPGSLAAANQPQDDESPTSSATSAMTPASIHFPPVNSRKPGLGWEFGRSSLISLIRQRPNPVPKPRPATGSSCATSGYPAYPPCTDCTVQDPKSVRSRANRLIRARFRLRPCPKKAGSDSSEVPRIQGPNCTAR